MITDFFKLQQIQASRLRTSMCRLRVIRSFPGSPGFTRIFTCTRAQVHNQELLNMSIVTLVTKGSTTTIYHFFGSMSKNILKMWNPPLAPPRSDAGSGSVQAKKTSSFEFSFNCRKEYIRKYQLLSWVSLKSDTVTAQSWALVNPTWIM